MGPDNIRSQQRHPSSFRVDFDATFDFMSLVPESQLTNLWYWSDHGHPYGWRYMDSFPIHTFRWVNAKGEGVYVRYKITSSQGIKNFSFPEAVQMCGEDPDFAKRDLWQHIEDGGVAEWIWHVQVMTEEQAQTYYVDPFDATKRWNDKDCPPQQLGRIVINRNPENYHRDVEQAAFSPGRLVPGIEPSPDALLQWRLVFYNDAQIYRLGVNYHQSHYSAPHTTSHRALLTIIARRGQLLTSLLCRSPLLPDSPCSSGQLPLPRGAVPPAQPRRADARGQQRRGRIALLPQLLHQPSRTPAGLRPRRLDRPPHPGRPVPPLALALVAEAGR